MIAVARMDDRGRIVVPKHLRNYITSTLTIYEIIVIIAGLLGKL